MTEQQWLFAHDYQAMFAAVAGSLPTLARKASSRQLRMLACVMATLIPEWTGFCTGDIQDYEKLEQELSGKSVVVVPLHLCQQFADTLRVFHPDRYPSCALFLRDIVGNPFRPVSKIHRLFGEGEPVRDPQLLDTCFLTPTVLDLAQFAYDDLTASLRINPDHLGVLRDALADAGCDNEAVLAHLCTQAEESTDHHVRGCWVLDLILAKRDT